MNPFLPLDICIPDAEPRVFGERVYIYGSYDHLGEMDYCSHEYYVFSASIYDLSHWTNHGVSFASKGPNDEVPWSNEKLYAPDVIEKDGVYYLYFCLADGSEGVARSQFPEGPFSHAKQMFYPDTIQDGKPLEHIDPAIFIDDDKSVYYYWGQFSGQCGRIRENMYEIVAESYNSEMVSEQEHFFHEGSSMRKIGDTYYFIFCDISSGRANRLSYATSKRPLGPFEYQGVIIDNYDADPDSWNNHGSIIQIQEQWYVFYHRSCNNSRFSRRACAEPITINENGQINIVEMTSQGFDKPLFAYKRILAARACLVSGGNYIKANNKGVHLLVNNLSGSLAAYKYFDFGEDKYSSLKIELGVYKEARDGKVLIICDNERNNPIGTMDLNDLVANTWMNNSIVIDPIYGVKSIYMRFESDNSDESICQIKWIEFTRL